MSSNRSWPSSDRPFDKLKRALDILVSLAGLAALSPLMTAVMVWIRLDSRGPVFFRQVRVGRGGRPFLIFKFRTMSADEDDRGPVITAGGDRRITAAGRFLRRTKLDEVPQLINVLAGDMSLVGPRPEVPRFVRLFQKDYDRILAVRPGITDYASLEFRDENERLSGAEDPEAAYVREILPRKIDLYKKYLQERSAATDLALLARTLGSVCRPSARASRRV